MDDNDLQNNLNVVNIVSQQSLEQKIGDNVDTLTKRKLIEQETNRLDRTKNLYEKLRGQLGSLRRRLNQSNRISIKAKLRKEIQQLQENEIEDTLKDIKEIRTRIKELKESTTLKRNDTDKDGRKDGESERDFLVRTGQLTAFGSTSGFVIDTEYDNTNTHDNHEDTVKSETDAESELLKNDYEMANEQMVENLSSTSSESDYIPEEDFDIETNSKNDHSLDDELSDTDLVIDKGKIKVSEANDDGDELSYQKRLRKWVVQRSANRQNDPYKSLPEWQKPHPEIPDARLNDIFKIPGDIYPLLFNYQKTCVQWLYELYQQGAGGIVGDEMGLGKTIQVIAFLAALHHSGLLHGPILIVCPATVMKQWVNELHHWWPPFRSVILHSIGSGMSDKMNMNEDEFEELMMSSNPDQFSYNDFENSKKAKSSLESSMHIENLIKRVVDNGHILITTYVGLRIHSDKLLKINWAYAVLDEGHKIRNPDSEISLTSKKLKTPNRIILSGTPIQNNLNELWSLFDFIYPGKLGTLPIFQQQFVIPINTGGYANATNIQVQTGYKCAVALRDLIAPYLLRRVKSDVAKDLPQKKEMVLFCKLTQLQRSRYLEFLNSNELTQIKGGRRHVLYGIDILRKICNHPDLLDREQRQHELDYGNSKRSGKMQVVKQLLLLWKKDGNKTLLFTQSKQMLDILEKFVSGADPELANMSYLRMDGSTNISKRQALVDRFNNENIDVFLLTTKVGGLGINLTGANRIIIFDPDWNPSTDLQARERAWRIGQKREVSIYRLMVSGSIEEKIYHRQIFKQFLTNKILTDPKQKRFFKMNELQDLFSLGGDDGLASEELANEVERHTQTLKESKSKQSDDFEQVASISGVSKLEGFFSKEVNDEKKSEDDRLIEGLLGEQGNLENASTHDQVVGSHMASKVSTNMISKEADRIAGQAVSAIRESRKKTQKYNIGTPTWTGKFGEAGKIVKKKPKALGKNAIGSTDILKNIRQRQSESLHTSTDNLIDDPNRKIMMNIVELLNSVEENMLSSSSIINHLGVNMKEKKDIINIRALLRAVATFDKNKKVWKLNSEFRTSINT
ncbi:similar to Saccharomyces cerevisiae YJR035W RAD26 Protein involved in transcription-coupled nucleotide excision repair of UV-induced DNA lesions [Maudiozyma saulgeensis]|uniref:DNA helicase n=1 Tax=Maudiozyma saulgeensis TaxID=1789683 RepID=A0A1X7R117_9SACH|nr:similar to Saccharomyces cerevisiae YJR035W RAD26 Protein involved in transcription-coupled nucleotide excision repair of UV-induced DNA lesions [Kazachstania saulgeensis]